MIEKGQKEFLRVAVLGARRAKQGTGEYIARDFIAAGHHIVGILGTSSQSVEETRLKLHEKYKIKCPGYTSIEELTQKHDIDVIVIASPIDTHWRFLEFLSEKHYHVFCEKPLWWSEDNLDTEEVQIKTENLIEAFDHNKRILWLNTQWPFTLPSYNELYSTVCKKNKIENFEMWMSPVTNGREMLIDSGPHFFSMLFALLGAGELSSIDISYSVNEKNKLATLNLESIYTHQKGETIVKFFLKQCKDSPRPAGYAINGKSAERHIKMPEYLLSLSNKTNSVTMNDPLNESVKSFVEAVNKNKKTDREAIKNNMVNLHKVVRAFSE